MAAEVLLILNSEFANLIVSSARQMPLWVVESQVNSPIIAEARSLVGCGNITEILTRPGETKADLLARSMDDIELHHGALSTNSPYNKLIVFGAKAELANEIASDLGFGIVYETAEGFTALKTKTL